MRSFNHLLLLLMGLPLAACGARTTLDPMAHDDAGTDAPTDAPADAADAPPPVDAGPDGGFDAGPPDLEVVCSDFQMVRPGITARVSGEVMSAFVPPLTHRWDQVENMGMEIDMPTGPASNVRSNVGGRHGLRYSVSDAAGSTGTCTTVVAVVNGPPVAACPIDPVVGPAGMPLMVVGNGFDDDGIVSQEWTLLEGNLDILDPGSFETTVIGSQAGINRLQLTVMDTDGASDSCIATVRLTAPPVLDCPDTIRAPTRQPLTITVPGRDDRSIVRHAWQVLATPMDDPDFALTSTRDNVAQMTPNRRGTYQLRYTATDDDDLSAFCEITVIGTPTPPTLTCPSEVRTQPLETVEVTASAVDDGTIVRWDWRRTAEPEGSAAGEPTSGAPTTRFTTDIAGRYELALTVTDDDGMQATCAVQVLAISDQGLRLEVNWDTATDMDTHLLNPVATQWEDNNDCFYQNCRGERLDWGVPGVNEDDPRLDIDDTNGFGPENINIDVPADGPYRAGVVAFSGDARVTMRIYCGGSRLEPAETFGPVLVRSGQLWRVADIEIDGVDCTITPLLTPGGAPDVSNDRARR